jgi:DNA-binding MarR family transcriptional regulator
VSQSIKSDDAESTIAALVMYSARLGRAVSRVSLADVPAATLRLLSQIDELAPVGIGRLAEADRCSQPTMSGAVQKLADKGWVTKTPHPTDARSSLVDLTPAGATVLRGARSRMAAVVGERLDADACHDLDDVRAAVTLLQHLLREEGTS